MTALYKGDLEAIIRAMEVATDHRNDHPDYDLEIAIGDSNGEQVGTVKYMNDDYVFEPSTC